jgi:hypothetical protein
VNDQARRFLVVNGTSINIGSGFSTCLKVLEATLVCSEIDMVGLMMLDFHLSVWAGMGLFFVWVVARYQYDACEWLCHLITAVLGYIVMIFMALPADWPSAFITLVTISRRKSNLIVSLA